MDITKFRKFYGPYRERDDRWLVFGVRVADGKREAVRFSSEAEASSWVAAARKIASGPAALTMGEVLDRYEKHMRNDKQLRERSIQTCIHQLDKFFSERDMLLVRLTEAKCKAYNQAILDAYESIDTRLNHLNAARTFCKWAVEEKLLKDNPVIGIKRVGRRRKGKDQLRIDEALKWIDKAIERAQAGDDGAVAAMMALIMGLRASEIVTRVVRDVDDGGRLLWVDKNTRAKFDVKTETGRRTLQIPPLLQGFIGALTVGKAPTDYLFIAGKKVGERYKAEHRCKEFVNDRVHAICAAAGVPEVTAHGMRGLTATLAIDAGGIPNMVAATLGHASFATTAAHYAKTESIDAARMKRARARLGME
jgi:integrase/recombinase XerC